MSVMRHWTIRVRLTALYGGMFFLAGAVLLAVTYVLVRQSIDTRNVGLYDPGTLDRLPEIIRSRFDPDLLAQIQADLQRQKEEFRAETLDSLLTQGIIALGVVGVVAIGFGWLMADRVLRPLHLITDTAQRIARADAAGGGLHERIALAGPRDEIATLADTFDAMLERLDRSFEGQRRLVANASHELRTPLAINRALIELAITHPDASPDAKALGTSLLTINARHERLIDGLLTLAESENGVADRRLVDLADIARHVVDEAAPAIGEAGLTVTCDLDPAPTSGDPVLLERLAQNLIENAVRHNREGGWLRVATIGKDSASAPRGGTPDRIQAVGKVSATLVVSNSGATVRPYEVETIFQPFRRLTRERVDGGFGLGLSIVAAVARAHGGQVTAEPQEGGGLVVTVTLDGARSRPSL